MNRKRSAVTRATPLDGAGRVVRDGVARSLKQLNAIETEIVDTVRDAVAETSSATPAVAADNIEALGGVVTGAVQAAGEKGTALDLCLKSVLKGIVIGIGDSGGDVARAVRRSVAHAVDAAVGIGADAGTAAKGCVSGVVEAAREMDADVVEFTRQSTTAAVAAAEAIGPAAVLSVKRMLAVEPERDVLSERSERAATSGDRTQESRKSDSESEQYPFY